MRIRIRLEYLTELIKLYLTGSGHFLEPNVPGGVRPVASAGATEARAPEQNFWPHQHLWPNHAV